MGRLIFVPGILECLNLKDEVEIKRCLYEKDVEILRVLLYNSFMGLASLYGCNGPIIMGVMSHDTVFVSVSRCRDPEGFSWDVAQFLEDLPGVWYVRAVKSDEGYRIETVPLYRLYG